MANHAQARTQRTLDPLEVDALIRKIVREELNDAFTVSFNPLENYWVCESGCPYTALEIELKDDFEYGVERDGQWIEHDEPVLLTEKSVVDFRHGHSADFMWWAEGVVRENVGAHYNAIMEDDGVGLIGAAQPEKYNMPYRQYYYSHEKSHRHFMNYQKAHIKTLPKEFVDKLGLDFLL